MSGAESFIIMQGTSALMGAASALGEAGIASEQAKFQASMAGHQAGIARLQAETALKRGEEQARIAAEEGARILGAQRAGYAGQGVEVGIGTPAQMAAETATRVATDVSNIRAAACAPVIPVELRTSEYLMKVDCTRR